jgi:hypothetical protein
MKQSIGGFVLAALAVTLAVSVAASAEPQGRYKKQGEACVWDAKDSGPNQCVPQTEGRFKKDGDKCVWADNENGPNQCNPKQPK